MRFKSRVIGSVSRKKLRQKGWLWLVPTKRSGDRNNEESATVNCWRWRRLLHAILPHPIPLHSIIQLHAIYFNARKVIWTFHVSTHTSPGKAAASHFAPKSNYDYVDFLSPRSLPFSLKNSPRQNFRFRPEGSFCPISGSAFFFAEGKQHQTFYM